jgi:tetrahedral aminopeptidase
MTENSVSTLPAPESGAAQIELLEKLCNASAVSGDEGEVRAIVLEQLQALQSELAPGKLTYKVDALGNVLVTRLGQGEDRLRVMVAAHMDEVGLMLVKDDEGGLYRFEKVGGIDDRQLVGKFVLVGKDHAQGVIGAKPIHFTDVEELRHEIPIEALRIDMGPEGPKVKPGDRAVFATRFALVGPSLRAKALDDRLGVATLIELIRHAPEAIDLLAAFTVQEEVGLRGARVAAYAFDPDLAIAVDSTPANDLPAWDGSENVSYNTHLGAGPAIYVADSGTLSDPRLVRSLVETADAEGIPYQFRQPGQGATDAAAIHLRRAGIPSVSVSVPSRYTHTPAGIARLEDWKNTLRLLHAVLRRLPGRAQWAASFRQ